MNILNTVKFIFRLFGIRPYYIKIKFKNYYRVIIDYIHYRQYPMFRDIVIETSSFCNRKCKNCPVSYSPRGKNEYIDNDVYIKILKELRDLNFYGRIALHFFNEPLADNSIVDKVKNARLIVKNSSIEINSNGDYLSNKLLTELVESGINKIFVTSYNEKSFFRIKKIYESCNEKEKKVLVFRKSPLFIGNRGGSLNNIVLTETLSANCFRPFYQLVINYKGNVVICCNDYYERIIIGNIINESILHIWNSDKFKNIRYLLSKCKRSKITTCVHCNLLSIPYHEEHLTNEQVIEYNRLNKKNCGIDNA